jgi:hypothetical protein
MAPARPSRISLNVASSGGPHHVAVVLRNVPTVETRVEYTASGSIYAFELARMLEAQLGGVMRLRFRPVPAGPATTAAWEAVTEDGAIVTGQLVLHAAITESEVMSWAVVSVDRTPWAVRLACVMIVYRDYPHTVVEFVLGRTEEAPETFRLLRSKLRPCEPLVPTMPCTLRPTSSLWT